MELPHAIIQNGQTQIHCCLQKKDRMVIDGFYKEVLDVLNQNQVRFLLVGGLAVGFYGYSRYTGDMDLWLDATTSNMVRLGKALKQLGYTEEAIFQVINERPPDHPTPIRLFEENEEFKVDLMTTIYYEPLTFEACFGRASMQQLHNSHVPVIGLEDLIEIKSQARRHDETLKDMVDAMELRKILERSQYRTISSQASWWQSLFSYFCKRGK